jgi:hypothetical protein
MENLVGWWLRARVAWSSNFPISVRRAGACDGYLRFLAPDNIAFTIHGATGILAADIGLKPGGTRWGD